ncbi:hypothetical protein AAHE18_15G050800 [Arachis hypogaea]
MQTRLLCGIFSCAIHALNLVNLEFEDLTYFIASQILVTESSIFFNPSFTIGFKICAQHRI